MEVFSKEELTQAARAIDSTRMKSEKAILKLKEGTAQHRLTARGIAAYSLALQLIAREQGEPQEAILYSKESLEQAVEAFEDGQLADDLGVVRQAACALLFFQGGHPVENQGLQVVAVGHRHQAGFALWKNEALLLTAASVDIIG